MVRSSGPTGPESRTGTKAWCALAARSHAAEHGLVGRLRTCTPYLDPYPAPCAAASPHASSERLDKQGGAQARATSQATLSPFLQQSPAVIVGSRGLAHALPCVWQQAVRPMPCGLSKMALAAAAPTAELDELQDQHSTQQRPCCGRWAAPLHRLACACATVLPAAGCLLQEPRLGCAAPTRQARGKARSALRMSGVRGGGSSCKSSLYSKHTHTQKKAGPPRGSGGLRRPRRVSC